MNIEQGIMNRRSEQPNFIIRNFLFNIRDLDLVWYISSVFCILHFSSLAQTPNWLWAQKGEGSYNQNFGTHVATDSVGNSYVIGTFGGTIGQFGSITLAGCVGWTNPADTNSSDIFIAKYDASGNILWAKRAGGTNWDLSYYGGIDIDKAGNCYVIGKFRQTATFGAFSLTAAGPANTYNIFVSKYDMNGTCLWVRQGISTQSGGGGSVSVDASGNVYAAGWWESSGPTSITFGAFTLTPPSQPSDRDIFIVKYDNNGTVLWAQRAGGPQADECRHVDNDSSGNVYITGDFRQTATFGTFSVTASGAFGDVFVAKYDPAGTCLWVRQSNGGGINMGVSISADKAGNSYITGSFTSNPITFGAFTLPLYTSFNIFIVKYDSNGNVLWATAPPQTGSINDGSDTHPDQAGGCYVAGNFMGSITFGSTVLTAAGSSQDNFIAKYNSAGNVNWALQGTWPNKSSQSGGVSTDALGNVYVSGGFADTVLFNTIQLESTLSSGGAFIAKIGLSSQDQWCQKANFMGTARSVAVGFSIGNKGYIGTGYDVTWKNDFWEWDKTSNTWTQKANFGGTPRLGATGFSIGTKGYIGCGNDAGNIYYNDLWEWDQASNTWTQKSSFPAGARWYPVAFSIGTKGYIGTGEGSISYNDFWEWDQPTDTWTQKTSFPATARRNAVGFSIGSKGYIGTGGYYNGAAWTFYNDFWEWDQTANTWTQKSNFAGAPRYRAAAFSIPQSGKGYIGTGRVVGGPYYQDFFEWDQATDTWAQKTNYSGGLRTDAVGFSIGCNGYIATGSDNIGTLYQDMWEWTPGPPCQSCNTVFNSTISTQSVTCNGLCNGSASVTPAGGTFPYSYAWNNGATSSTATGLCSGNYSVTVTDSVGNTTTASATITQPAPLNITVSNNTSVCQGAIATLTASGGTNYSWNTGQTTSSITVAATATATYSVLVTNANGCSKDTFTTVTVNPLPNPSISGNNTICFGNTATLTASGGINYSWSNSATTSSIAVSPTTSTTYSVIVSIGSCADTASALVSVISGVTANISGNTVLCTGDIATLTASGGTNYSWSNGATTSSITATATATITYSVIVSNGSCSDTTFATVTVSPPPVATISGNTIICQGDVAVLTASGGANYLWSNGQSTSSITISPLTTTNYSVVVSIGSCADTAYNTVVVLTNPVATAQTNVTINLGDNTTLSATGGGAYSWVPVLGLSNPNISNPVATPNATTDYCVYVTDAAGCKDSACVTVTVEINCKPVYVPNAFSPNEDGENDIFYVFGNCIKEMKLVIYNRWGEKVFESTDQKQGWDGANTTGVIKGSEGTAVFTYYLKATLLTNEEVSKKGNVSLIR